ncbi:pre-peptidase C-terminal domain-containing protein [Thermodesulfobacteriota bacterium]
MFCQDEGAFEFTDTDGSYHLILPPGDHDIFVYKAGYYTFWDSVAIPDGGILAHNFYLEPGGSTGLVFGVVTDCIADQPINNALVDTDEGDYTYSNAAGAYWLEIPEGSYIIEVSADGYFEKTFFVNMDPAFDPTIEQNACLVTSENLCSLSGIVSDSQMGNPLVDVTLSAFGDLFFTFTDEAGTYSMDVPSGPIDLHVEASGYVSQSIPINYATGETATLNVSLDMVQPTEDDHCNQPGSCATALVVNGAILSGNIETPGDEDWFVFQGNTGEVYKIETSDLGLGMDTVIQLYREDGTTLIGADDDGGVGFGSKIVWTAEQDGSFYIKVRHYESSKTGTYHIAVRGSDDHCNEAGLCATEISADGTPIPGNIEKIGDIDWFCFNAVSGLTYNADTFDLGAGSDTVISLLRADGITIIKEDDDSGDGFASAITWTADNDGMFFIRVRQLSGSETGSYHVRLTEFDDHCNTRTSCATMLGPYRGLVQGVFEADQDEDWFQFQGTPDIDYEIQTGNLSQDCDTFLSLYSADGQLITSDDNSGSGLASHILWSADAGGIFYILVKHTAPNGRGSYEMSLSASDDHANTFSYATLLATGGEPALGNIETGGDSDFFQFSVDAGRTYILETGNLGEGCDTVIELYEPNGEVLITSDNDSGVGFASRIDFSPETSGVYYALVRHNEQTGTSTYEISLREEDDHLNSAGNEATVLEIDGTKIDGRFEIAGDEDWFRFEAEANQLYVIETGDLLGRCDPLIELYETDGSTLLARDDDGGPGFASKLYWSPDISDTYFVRLRNFNASETGDYRIWVQSLPEDDAPDRFSNAKPVPTDGIPVSSQIERYGDIDWFKFNAQAEFAYQIESANLSDSADTIINLYGPDGVTPVLSDDDSGQGLGSRIVWTAEATGIYYIKVSHFESEGTGAYDLFIQEVSFSCISIDDGQSIDGSILQEGGGELYCMDIVAGDQVTVSLNGPSNGVDFDLYLKTGSPPELTDYAVRGYSMSAQETCELSVSSSNILYVRVHSFFGLGNYELVADIIPMQTECLTLNQAEVQIGNLNGTDDKLLYCLDVAEGDDLTVTLDGPETGADFDIFLKFGSVPTFSEYDSRGYSPSSNETASLSDLAAGIVYIRVVSYSGSGNFDLSAHVAKTQTDCIPLIKGQPLQDTLSFPTDGKLYCHDVAEGEQIGILLDGPLTDADFDLYVKFGAPPSITDYDVRSYTAASHEECVFTASVAGITYILIQSHFGTGNYIIQVYEPGQGPLSKLSSDPSNKLLFIKGSIEDRVTGKRIEPSRFCIAIKGLGKFCYNRDDNSNNQVIFIPGGYFFLILPAIVENNIALSVHNVPCYRDSEPFLFNMDQLSNTILKCEIDPILDCDNDGMNNIWEKRHGLNIWKNDADLDFDEDGYSNKEEYAADTDPSEKASVPMALQKMGDLDGSGILDLIDAVLILKLLAGLETPEMVCSGDGTTCLDVDGNTRIGMEEGIYILLRLAEMRD